MPLLEADFYLALPHIGHLKAVAINVVGAVKLMVLGAGLEPACLSAYAPQTYVSAIPPPERTFEDRGR
jgi:hypothetical protein